MPKLKYNHEGVCIKNEALLRSNITEFIRDIRKPDIREMWLAVVSMRVKDLQDILIDPSLSARNAKEWLTYNTTILNSLNKLN